MLAVTAIPGLMPGEPPAAWGAIVSLLLIALGTGGIKSSVSAFVGDQFVTGQEHLLATVFALFYWIINIGSLMSTILTPILRTISFALAFGVPAVLLLVATFVFWLGRNRFRRVPLGENVFRTVIHVIIASFRGWHRRRTSGASVADEKAPSSFWDYAKAEVNHDAVEDVKSAFRVMVIYLPLPLFWALFDQHSTRWVLQAEEMDRNIFGWFTLLPELVQVLDPAILIWLIWIFDRLLYPFLARLGFTLRPLKRMAIGMILTALSFVIAGIVQTHIANSPKKSVSVFLIIPQFFVLCCGEIMVSITGLEFSYTQAPASMKSILMSGWLSTVAVGNLIVSLVAQLKFGDMAMEFFFFAALMAFFTAVFLLIIQYYTYREDSKKTDSATQDSQDGKQIGNRPSSTPNSPKETDQTSLLSSGMEEADL